MAYRDEFVRKIVQYYADRTSHMRALDNGAEFIKQFLFLLQTDLHSAIESSNGAINMTIGTTESQISVFGTRLSFVREDGHILVTVAGGDGGHDLNVIDVIRPGLNDCAGNTGKRLDAELMSDYLERAFKVPLDNLLK